MSRRRVTAADIVPVTIGALVTALPFMMADQLPDPIAVHWAVDGRPDGEMSLRLFPLLPAGLLALGWLPCIAVRALARGSLVLVNYAMVGISTVLVLFTLWANRGASQWQDARRLSLIGGLALLATVLGLAAVIALSVRRAVREQLAWVPQDALPTTRPTIGLGKDERATGVYVVRSRWLALPSIIPLILVVPFKHSVPWLVLMGATALLILASVHVRLTITSHMIQVAFGPWHWPRRRIPMQDVTGARVESIHPMQYGGWGYRVGRGVRAIILKAGPALHIESAGQHLIITMPNPDEPAGLINDIVAGRSS